jgi:hypothetical protein
MNWKDGKLASATVLSRLGNKARIRTAGAVEVTAAGKAVTVTSPEAGVLEFPTQRGVTYTLTSNK